MEVRWGGKISLEGQTSLALILRFQPHDVIIIDLNRPKGYDFVREIVSPEK